MCVFSHLAPTSLLMVLTGAVGSSWNLWDTESAFPRYSQFERHSSPRFQINEYICLFELDYCRGVFSVTCRVFVTTGYELLAQCILTVQAPCPPLPIGFLHAVNERCQACNGGLFFSEYVFSNLLIRGPHPNNRSWKYSQSKTPVCKNAFQDTEGFICSIYLCKKALLFQNKVKMSLWSVSGRRGGIYFQTFFLELNCFFERTISVEYRSPVSSS